MKTSVKRRAKKLHTGSGFIGLFHCRLVCGLVLHSTAVYPRPCCRLGSNRRVGRDRPVTKRTCLLFPADYWRVCSFYAGSNSPLPSNLWREAYQGNYHAGCFLLTVCSRNRIFSAPDPMVWDWGADENFVPIYCNVCLLAAVDPALL